LGSEFHKGSAAHDGNDYIIYDKTTGNLYYDDDGTAGDPEVQFAKLDKGLHLHASDFIVFA
jgi:Ca2+-binding RTX toxin-like protein